MGPCQSIINAETPKFIPVADKPVRAGGKIEYLTIREFEKQFRFTFKEGVSIDKETKITAFQESVVGNVSSFQLKKQVEKLLKLGYDNLVICGMGALGHGVFALKDISKGSVTAIFSGTISNTIKIDVQDKALNYYGTNMSFSSKYHHGISHFMQHLPRTLKTPDVRSFCKLLQMMGQKVSEEQIRCEDELYSVKFTHKATEKLIMTENVDKEYLNFNGIPLIVLVANRQINAGEQIGFNYGYRYWSSRKMTPEFFDNTGAVISHSLYKRTFGQINFGNFRHMGEYGPLIASVNRGEAFVSIISENNESYKVSCAHLMSLLVGANAITEIFFTALEIHSDDVLEILPNRVNVVGDHGEIMASFGIATRRNIERFQNLRSIVGNSVIRRGAKRSDFSVTQEWLRQLKRINPEGISMLGTLFEDKENVLLSLID